MQSVSVEASNATAGVKPSFDNTNSPLRKLSRSATGALSTAQMMTQPVARSSIIAFRVLKSPSNLQNTVKTFLTLALYLIVSVSVMMALEPTWTTIDASYFAMMTMSTVGCARPRSRQACNAFVGSFRGRRVRVLCFRSRRSTRTCADGDISPSNTGARVMTAFMILFGVVFVFSAVAGVISQLTGPFTKRGRELLERAFPQIGVDLDGSGDFDFYQPRHPVLYYSKKHAPHLIFGTQTNGHPCTACAPVPTAT